MFSLFIVLRFNSSLEHYPAKCLFLNNEPCMVIPTLIDMDPVQLRYYPFMIRLNLFVCRHPTDPGLEVPTQNFLLDLQKHFFLVKKDFLR